MTRDILSSFSIDYEIVDSYINTNYDFKLVDNHSKTTDTQTPTLDLFSRNISEMAANDVLDKVIGRENEIIS